MTQPIHEREDVAARVEMPLPGDPPDETYDPEMTEEDEANAPDVEEGGDPGDREITQ